MSDTTALRAEIERLRAEIDWLREQETVLTHDAAVQEAEITRLRALTTPQPIETAPFDVDEATGERWLGPCYLFHTEWYFPVVGLCSGGVWLGRTDEGDCWELGKVPTGWAPIILGFWTQEELDRAKVKAEELSRAMNWEAPK